MAEDYFRWLYALTEENHPRRHVERNHWSLCQQLHTKPFRWFVANDDNRDSDARELRERFIEMFDIYEPDQPWLEVEASVLEVLIALAERVSFESHGTPSEWFWTFIQHLDLYKYDDGHYNMANAEEVDDALERFLQRDYGRDGTGGLFPLRRPRRDQRRVEIWYQMSSYLLEGNDIANGP